MTESPFDADPQMAAMKQDIADRSFNIQLKGYLISGALAIAAVAVFFLVPEAALAMGSMGPLLFAGVFAAGSGLAAMMTLKETEKLKIDEEFLKSRIQGKNYWGSGYREEVAEHGYAGPQAPFQNGPPPQNKTLSRG